MKIITKIAGKKVAINYDKRTELAPILIFIADCIRDYNHSRYTPIGFKSFTEIN